MPSILDYIFSSNKLIEGTDYFGRILLSLSLNSMDRPSKGVFPLNSSREPPTVNYILRVDVYEVQGAKNCEGIKVKVKFGSAQCDSQVANRKKDHEKSQLDKKKAYLQDAFEWKENKVQLTEINSELPVDKTQVPDIIISLYSMSKFSSDYKRVAYMRFPATSPDCSVNKPKWYALKSIENNLDSAVHSFILLNVSLRIGGTSS